MFPKKSIFFVSIALFSILAAPLNQAQAKPKKKEKPAAEKAVEKLPVSPQKAFRIAEKAYTYGYPLVLMNETKKILTNIPKPTRQAAPINQFAHMPTFPDSYFTSVVRPNADTLYSTAFLDLSKEPMVLHVPNTKRRYYLMQLMDAWSNVFASLGKRTTGTKEENFVIIGPNWKGEIPRGLEEVESPTNLVWIIGRTQTNGPSDYRKVNKIQKNYTLTPLSAFKKKYTPPQVSIDPAIDMKTSPAKKVDEMDTAAFFSEFAKLLAKTPPNEEEQSMVKQFAKIGIVPGKPFDPEKLSPKALEKVKQGSRYAQKNIQILAGNRNIVNGWRIMTSGMGAYGRDYLQRARVAYAGLGANLPQDAVYPMVTTDHTGKVLHGSNNYVIHFKKNQLPPVKGFWSITLYNASQLFAANPINRYSIGDRNKLKFNRDGSLSIYIQHQSPGVDKESNWLPSPMGKFDLTMRLYWPKSSALNGVWTPPAVYRISKKRGY